MLRILRHYAKEKFNEHGAWQEQTYNKLVRQPVEFKFSKYNLFLNKNF